MVQVCICTDDGIVWKQTYLVGKDTFMTHIYTVHDPQMRGAQKHKHVPGTVQALCESSYEEQSLSLSDSEG